MAQKRVIGTYELGKTLGSGAYSTVRKAVHIDTRKEVAMKIMDDNCTIQDIDREIAILKLLKHPNIIRLLDVLHDEETKVTCLAFELVSGGDLFDYTIARGRLTEREARRIMREIVAAVAYCHAHMVVHRDLKLENVLMDKDGHARIADFGLSSIMKPGLRMHTFCGSPLYMSPEIMQGLGYGPGADIWSMGVMLFAIVIGMTPWKLTKQNAVEDIDALMRGEYYIPEHAKLSNSCKDLLDKMLVPNPAKRASIEEIMGHPWLMETYDHPVSIPANLAPTTDFSEVNEVILKQMIAMGYPYDASTLASSSPKGPTPSLMVYHHMLQQMEEEEKKSLPIQPHPWKTHKRRSSAGAVSPTPTRKIVENTSPRARSTEVLKLKTRRASCEIPAQFMQSEMPQISPRAVLNAPWRNLVQMQMSPISEEPIHEVATEDPQADPAARRPARLRIPGAGGLSPSPPLSPFTEEIPVVRGAFNVATTTLKPRRALLTEIGRALSELGIEHSLVRSTFECAVGEEEKDKPVLPPILPPISLAKYAPAEKKGEKTTGQLRRALAGLKVDVNSVGKKIEKEEGGGEEMGGWSRSPDRAAMERRAFDDEDGEEMGRWWGWDKERESEVEDFGRLKFTVEVCRVSGLEMLLAVRFHRMMGNAWEYQEICNRLMATMKL